MTCQQRFKCNINIKITIHGGHFKIIYCVVIPWVLQERLYDKPFTVVCLTYIHLLCYSWEQVHIPLANVNRYVKRYWQTNNKIWLCCKYNFHIMSHNIAEFGTQKMVLCDFNCIGNAEILTQKLQSLTWKNNNFTFFLIRSSNFYSISIKRAVSCILILT